MRAAWTSERSLQLTIDGNDPRLALRVARALEASAIAGVRSVHSTLGLVCVRLEEDRLDRAEAVERAAIEAARNAETARELDVPARLVTVPVCYDAELAPDLEPLARELGLSIRELVEAHTGAEHLASFLGFAPGFAYLTGVDPRLRVPRLPSPRARVEAGSVAAAGGFTGVYPRAMPGGWRVIGRTHLQMFDPARDRPCAIEPGDRVRFTPISRREFEAAERARDA